MIKAKKPAAAVLAAVLAVNMCGCSLPLIKSRDDIKVFTGYFAMSGKAADKNNDIVKLIAEKTGARCEETWKSSGQSAEETISDMIISKKYPDFIYGGVGQKLLLDAEALIPLNKYWDEYENIKNYFTSEQWKLIEDQNGFIYYIPVYSNEYIKDTDPEHNGEAFWIQVKVLEWDNYPEINTLDEYFDLIERYLKANPVSEDGTPYIGYEILTDGYLYFGMENPPQFLDGYPNDGACIVDSETLTAVDYNTTPTARRWFRKLNEEYQKGIVDPSFSFMNADDYYKKIRSGAVLAMNDQHWNFSACEDELPADSKYIPLDLVIDNGIEPHYKSPSVLDVSQGLGISVDCDDVESALKFIDDLLSPEIMTLRFWGIEGKDYEKDSDGRFYRTENQRTRSFSTEYAEEHFCEYTGFPYYAGMNLDGINAFRPDNQPEEYIRTLGGPVKRCLESYGVSTPSELINSTAENPPWFPMWSYTNLFTGDTDYGKAKIAMDEVKHRYLPKVIMSSDFESLWDEYMTAYSSCDTSSYFNALNAEIKRRAGKKR